MLLGSVRGEHPPLVANEHPERDHRAHKKLLGAYAPTTPCGLCWSGHHTGRFHHLHRGRRGGGQIIQRAALTVTTGPGHRPRDTHRHRHAVAGVAVTVTDPPGTVAVASWSCHWSSLSSSDVLPLHCAPNCRLLVVRCVQAGSYLGNHRGRGHVAINPHERMKVWVRAGGRCTICGTYLLEGKITYRKFTLGELAHIVGRDVKPGSPRGSDLLPKEKRDLAENLILLCRDEHNEIDRKGSLSVMTVDRLHKIKSEHEDWIRRVTSLSRQNGTVVIRVIGRVRGREVELTKSTAAEAVIRSDERFPDFPLSLHGDGFEIDLRYALGEEEAGLSYWEHCKQQIDQILEYRLAEALRKDAVQHVSVFGFARLPLLVYFGSRIDDTFSVTIYQRHRATEAWSWPDGEVPTTLFCVDSPGGESQEEEEGVLVLNVSGTIQSDEIPDHLASLPRWTIAPQDETPSVDVINSLATLDEFAGALRLLFSEVEAHRKNIRKIHVLAAVPLSAAVALGRAHDGHVHPNMSIYERTDGRYTVALEIK